VRSDSALGAIADVDRPGVRIAVGTGAAYDLYLTRSLKRAAFVRAPTANAAFELFMNDGLEAAAGGAKSSFDSRAFAAACASWTMPS
jgi:polar amino acid transport system substrate-binding protein